MTPVTMFPMSNATSIDAGKGSNRRELHFSQIDDVLADGEQLAAAEREGKARCLGNWTLGQIFGHLSSWVDYSYEGVPMKVPFLIRLIMRPMKNRILYKAMPAGRNIPRVPGGTLATEPLSLDDGLAHFRRSFGRLKSEAPVLPHVLFGPLTHEEWINQHLRHAELHLSFVRFD